MLLVHRAIMTVTDHFRTIEVCFPDKNWFDVVVVVFGIVVYAYDNNF